MRLFLTLNKRNIVVLITAILLLFLILIRIYYTDITSIDGSTYESRAAYLKILGYEVKEETAIKETVIPGEFNQVYEEYNLLQKESGFDLSQYKTRVCTVYTYSLLGIDTKVANLIVCGGKIIGGDILDLENSQNITPLGRKD